MNRQSNQRKPTLATLAVAASLYLVSGLFPGSSAQGGQPVLLKSTAQNALHPGTPMVLDPVSGGFEFDLGGSETPKLQLQLSQPLMLESGSHLPTSLPHSNLIGLDATLRMPVGEGLSLSSGLEQNVQFQTFGSIQCLNGTLKPDSYTASGCRFVTDPGVTFDRRTLSFGASQELGKVTSSVNWFTTMTESGAKGVYALNQSSPAPLVDNHLLMPAMSTGVLTGSGPAGYLVGETTGIDLNFQVGFTTGQTGDVRLGLALTRVLDANYQGTYGQSPGLLDWNLAESFDAAALGVEWTHGSFSGGLSGYYREPVTFLNREQLDSSGTFDVHFTWRTPWNANLSVGTRNVLGAGIDDGSSNSKSADRFESIYGRIPYVRYQQDL
jgi:hypothetical protein